MYLLAYTNVDTLEFCVMGCVTKQFRSALVGGCHNKPWHDNVMIILVKNSKLKIFTPVSILTMLDSLYPRMLYMLHVDKATASSTIAQHC